MLSHDQLEEYLLARAHADPAAMHRALAGAAALLESSALREWMVPLVERGEVRQTSMLMIAAIVSGPAHAIARRWLAGQIESPLTAFADELADAACAGLRGTRVRAVRRAAARRARAAWRWSSSPRTAAW